MSSKPGTIHRTIALLQSALNDLGASMPLAHIERIGVMVNRGMSAQQRRFHTPEHIFGLASGASPHAMLAALFHDLVYYQVDHGLTTEIQTLIAPYVRTVGDDLVIADQIPPTARAAWGCMAVFGFQPGQKLVITGGLNEFLSALVMDLLFVDAVRDADLMVATACIEATIPFRGPNAAGLLPPEALAARLKETNRQFGLGLTPSVLDAAVAEAVVFANKDVVNFAEPDVTNFLENTWKLLPENNPELRMVGLYSIVSFRVAVQKMGGFLCFLNPDYVFQRYAGVPSTAEFARMRDAAAANLSNACSYLGIRLITAGILEACAELTGGDAPIAYFMGGISESDQNLRLADFLPYAAPLEDERQPGQVGYLLAHGGIDRDSSDLHSSPLSLFVYRSFGGKNGCSEARETAKQYFSNAISAKEFLTRLPKTIVAAVAGAAAELVFTRQDALRELAASFT